MKAKMEELKKQLPPELASLIDTLSDISVHVINFPSEVLRDDAATVGLLAVQHAVKDEPDMAGLLARASGALLYMASYVAKMKEGKGAENEPSGTSQEKYN